MRINWDKVKKGDVAELRGGYGTRKIVSLEKGAGKVQRIEVKGDTGGTFLVMRSEVEAVYRLVK